VKGSAIATAIAVSGLLIVLATSFVLTQDRSEKIQNIEEETKSKTNFSDNSHRDNSYTAENISSKPNNEEGKNGGEKIKRGEENKTENSSRCNVKTPLSKKEVSDECKPAFRIIKPANKTYSQSQIPIKIKIIEDGDGNYNPTYCSLEFKHSKNFHRGGFIEGLSSSASINETLEGNFTARKDGSQTLKVNCTEGDTSLSSTKNISYSTSLDLVDELQKNIVPLEKNGDPEEKINIIMHGHNMSPTKKRAVTVSELKEVSETHISDFFDKGDLDYMQDYREYFNWYYINESRSLCKEVSTSSNPDDIDPECDRLINRIGATDKMKDSNWAVVVITPNKWTGSALEFSAHIRYDPNERYEFRSETFIEEVMHIVFGFSDEYTDRYIPTHTTTFFPEEMSSENFNPLKYPNTFPTEQACESNITHYYPETSTERCKSADGKEKNWRIVKLGDNNPHDNDNISESFIGGDRMLLFPTHRKRIDYLLTQSPKYTEN
jgi:hypothetical protein